MKTRKLKILALMVLVSINGLAQQADKSKDETITGLWKFENEVQITDNKYGLKRIMPIDCWVKTFDNAIYVRDIHRSFKYGGTINNPTATPTNSYIYSHEWGDSYKWNHGAQTIRIKGATADGIWQWAIKNGDYNSSAEIISINNIGSGRVGIKQSNPTEALDVNGNIKSNNYIKAGRLGFKGTYNSSQVQGIWSIDTGWGISTSNNDFGNQYGMVYAHTNAGSSPTLGAKKPISGWGHQILFVNNGATKVSISSELGRIWANDMIKANYFSAAGTIGYNCDPGNGRGYRFWSSDAYKIYMSSHSDGSWGGRLDKASDYNMYFKMSGGTNRGWYFKNTTTGKGVHIVGNGDIIAQGKITSNEVEVKDMAVNNINLAGDLAANNITLTTNGNTADFVFAESYQLTPLSKVESFIKTNKHLPEIPSAAQMEEQGVNLAEMNKLLLQKVEELTLYAIEMEKARNKEELEREKLEERLIKLEKLLIKSE